MDSGFLEKLTLKVKNSSNSIGVDDRNKKWPSKDDHKYLKNNTLNYYYSPFT